MKPGKRPGGLFGLLVRHDLLFTLTLLVLLALALSVNLVGDWLRDALNPKLQ